MSFKLNKKDHVISDINITPFIDVILVLLLIFMITAPLMFSGIKLDLPKTKKVHGLKLNNEKVIISVDQKGHLYFDKKMYTSGDLIKLLLSTMKSKTDQSIYVRADGALKYEKLANLMADLKRSGLSQISLVTEIESEK